MNRNALFALIAVAIIIACVFAYNEGLFRIKEIDTETHKVQWSHFGDICLKGVQYDPVDNNDNELLDQSKYVTSWHPDGQSEKIIPCIAVDGWSVLQAIKIEKYWIVVKLDPNANWDNPAYESSPDNPYCDKIIFPQVDGGRNPGQIRVDITPKVVEGVFIFENIELPRGEDFTYFKLVGQLSGYFMRVEIHVKFSWIGLTGYKTKVVTISDEAYLLSGEGNVEVVYPDGYDEVEEGETVTFKVYTGFSGPAVAEPDKRWILELHYPENYPGHEGEILETWKIPDNRHPYEVQWTVPKGIWKPNIKPFTVVLRNQLIAQDDEWFVVVDVREKMPPPPQIITEKDWFYINEPVNVTIIAEPNEIVNLPISKIYYAVWYGEQEEQNYIIPPWREATPTESNGKYIVKFTFTATYEKTVQIASYCVDTEGRQSNIAYRGVTIVGAGPSYMTLAPSQQLVYHVTETVKCLSSSKPDTLIAKFIDSRGKVVYVDEFKPSVVQKTSSDGLYDYYHVEGTVTFTVPAFAKTGDWVAIIYIVDKNAWLWKDDYMKTVTVKFTVVDGTLTQDLLAPIYFYKEFGWWILKKEISWKLPPPIVWIAGVIAILAIIAFIFVRRNSQKRE